MSFSVADPKSLYSLIQSFNHYKNLALHFQSISCLKSHIRQRSGLTKKSPLSFIFKRSDP